MRLILAALLLLGACQPLPHPFADAAGPDATPALRPPDSAGILVLPVAAAPPLAAALAQKLRDADVPASTEQANRGSYRLESTVAEENPAPGSSAMALRWELKTASGETVGRGTSRRDDAAEGAQADDRAMVAALAADAAPKIAQLVSGDAPPPAGDVPPLVAVRGIAGAPGDGGPILARAIGAALQRAGFEVGEADARARFALSCRIAVAPPQDGKQLVTVRWALALAEGRELGQVSQQNDVPAGSLNGQWGDLAYAIAGAAAPGIAELIEKAKTAAPGG
jgi:hypothetical protein